MKMTSAYANKLIKKLQEDRDYWREIEKVRHKYVVAPGEEAIIPEYDFLEVYRSIAELDEKIIKVKHALNVSNSTNSVEVAGKKYTIDMLLVKMAQMTERKAVLGAMRKLTPKSRVEVRESVFGRVTATPTSDIQYINFDMDVVKAEYDQIERFINELLLTLDKYNQTVEFDVDI